MMRKILLLVVALCLFCTAPVALSQGQAVAEAAVETGPVPIPEATPEALEFYRFDNLVALLTPIEIAVTTLLVLFLGLSAWMRDNGRKVSKNWIVVLLIWEFQYAIWDFALAFPRSLYAFLKGREFGQEEGTVGAWFVESVVELLGALLVVIPLLIVIYFLLRRRPRDWWIFAAATIAVVLTVVPMIQSATEKREPLADTELAAQVASLAQRAGLAEVAIYKTESVRRIAVHGGVLSEKRILVVEPDDQLDRDQIAFLAARAMGSHRLKHGIQEAVILLILLVLTLYLIHRVAGYLIEKFKDRWRVESLADIAGYPLMFLLMNLPVLFLTPIPNALSRHAHIESDRFALELVQDSRTAAETLIQIESKALTNPRPGPIRSFMHPKPSLASRVEMCNEYRPWETGEELRYGDLLDQG